MEGFFAFQGFSLVCVIVLAELLKFLFFYIYHHLWFTVLLFFYKVVYCVAIITLFCCSCSFLVAFALFPLLVAMFFPTLNQDLLHLSWGSTRNSFSILGHDWFCSILTDSWLILQNLDWLCRLILQIFFPSFVHN